jgi:hypothetical protein
MTSLSQVPIPTLSSRTLRWKRLVCWAALYSASCTIAATVGPMLTEPKRVGVWLPLSAYVVSTVPTSIFWLPCLWVCFRLRGEGSRKSALALAVGMGGVQFFLFAVVRSAAHAWDEKWWIQGLLLSALLAQPLMAGAAIRVYYSLPSERRDRLKLLASCSYSFVLLLLLAEQILSNSYVAGPIPRNQSAVVQRMWKINQASADYADKFGGVYPFDLAALETEGPSQQSDCKASGLLDRGFDEKKYGYRIEYKAGSRSDAATVGCAGSNTYAITARPTVLARTGLQNFFMDESGVLRATREDRTATASDPSP